MVGEPPVLKAMLVCERIITDRATGTNSLIGVFNNFNYAGASLPIVFPPMWVYVKLTDIEGRHDFRLELVRVSDNMKLGQGLAEDVEIPDRFEPAELCLQLPPIRYEQDGAYEIRLFADNQFVGHVTFNVMPLRRTP